MASIMCRPPCVNKLWYASSISSEIFIQRMFQLSYINIWKIFIGLSRGEARRDRRTNRRTDAGNDKIPSASITSINLWQIVQQSSSSVVNVQLEYTCWAAGSVRAKMQQIESLPIAPWAQTPSCKIYQLRNHVLQLAATFGASSARHAGGLNISEAVISTKTTKTSDTMTINELIMTRMYKEQQTSCCTSRRHRAVHVESQIVPLFPQSLTIRVVGSVLNDACRRYEKFIVLGQ